MTTTAGKESMSTEIETSSKQISPEERLRLEEYFPITCFVLIFKGSKVAAGWVVRLILLFSGGLTL